MKIGLAYDLKQAVTRTNDQPEDALEEYDSPETVEGITRAIEALGHSVVALGGGREFLSRVVKEDVDLVFNIAEGMGDYRSREAQVPSVLEMLGIPYTGSDPQCLAIALDKSLTKKLVALAGVRTPQWQVAEPGQPVPLSSGFPLPAFVKPAYEGSSKGIRLGSRVETKQELIDAITALMSQYRQPVIVEQYIAGDEVTVGVVGNCPPQVLGIMRVVPKNECAHFVYSLEIKRDWENLVEYECPAKLEPDVLDEIEKASLKAFEILGCRDCARLDFRVDPAGAPYFLEINPLPGLNPGSSDLPILAGKMGWTYGGLISAVLGSALQRYPQCISK